MESSAININVRHYHDAWCQDPDTTQYATGTRTATLDQHGELLRTRIRRVLPTCFLDLGGISREAMSPTRCPGMFLLHFENGDGGFGEHGNTRTITQHENENESKCSVYFLVG